jgi:SnoaL-like domain
MTREELKNAVKEVHALTGEGKAIEAMQKYYADNVVMIEDNGVATEGLEANLERERQFFASITELREMKILETFVYDDLVVTTSSMDLDLNGQTYKGTQVSVTEWKDGKVVREQFIYKSF